MRSIQRAWFGECAGMWCSVHFEHRGWCRSLQDCFRPCKVVRFSGHTARMHHFSSSFSVRPLRWAQLGAFAWLVVIGCSLTSPVAHAGEEVYEARVSRVHDGDTLWVQPVEGGRYRKLRIDGIDAPEICQAGGVAARDALRQRVMDRVVTVRERSLDRYGRALVKLSLGQEDVAGWLVDRGLAWSYRWRRDMGPYADQEAVARDRRLGLFVESQPELPGDFRKRHGPCPQR